MLSARYYHLKSHTETPFTKAAQQRNAENVLLIADNPTLAQTYVDNWKRRAEVSRRYKDFHGNLEQ
jgi:hypothetical protein